MVVVPVVSQCGNTRLPFVTASVLGSHSKHFNWTSVLVWTIIMRQRYQCINRLYTLVAKAWGLGEEKGLGIFEIVSFLVFGNGGREDS